MMKYSGAELENLEDTLECTDGKFEDMRARLVNTRSAIGACRLDKLRNQIRLETRKQLKMKTERLSHLEKLGRTWARPTNLTSSVGGTELSKKMLQGIRDFLYARRNRLIANPDLDPKTRKYLNLLESVISRTTTS
jgi:hypothetical protein